MANNDKLLVSNEWKHTLETTPTKSLNSLVSLYDLFYNEEGTLWVQSGNDSTNIGTKLDHDIICLNRSMLTATNSIDTSSAAMSANTWWTYGIDVSIPKYDSRSKYRTFTNRAQIKQQATAKNLFKTNSYNIYDKEAALAPSNITIFSKNGVLTGDMASSLEWTTYTPPSIGVWDGNSDLSGMTEDIILAAPDVAFRSTLVTQSNLSAYNKIFINPYTPFGIALIVKALGIDPTIIGVQAGVFQGLTSSNIQEGLLDNSHPLSALWEPMPKRGINSLVASINFNGYAIDVSSDFDGNGSAEFDQNRFKNILKETYVWVRAPFFADYIVTESFGQDLNTTAKVKHSELMLSGAGDFKKYDAYLTGKSTRLSLDSDPSSADNNVTANASLTGIGFNDANNIESGLTDGSVDQEDIDKLSENTLPYIPKTSPTVDFYTAAFVSEKLERAAKGADVLYTDVWTSMGEEAERDVRFAALHTYQINDELLG